MASMTSSSKYGVTYNYSDVIKQIKRLPDDIIRLKKGCFYVNPLPKIQNDKLIKDKEEELTNYEEWLNSKEGIENTIVYFEKLIKFNIGCIQNNHPMTTTQDIKEMNEEIHKYEEELKVYNDKLNEFNKNQTLKKEVKELKQPKVKEPKPPKVKEPKPPKVKEPKPPKEDKLKKKAIPSTIKKLVWNTNIGEDIGKAKCICCKSTDITQMSFNCGHVISEYNGGETIVSNLKPICQNCNSSMGTKNMNDFMLTLL